MITFGILMFSCLLKPNLKSVFQNYKNETPLEGGEEGELGLLQLRVGESAELGLPHRRVQ